MLFDEKCAEGGLLGSLGFFGGRRGNLVSSRRVCFACEEAADFLLFSGELQEVCCAIGWESFTGLDGKVECGYDGTMVAPHDVRPG